MIHERTIQGRRYLTAASAVKEWIVDFRWCASPHAIWLAENFVCELNATAWNGLALRLDALTKNIDEMDKYKGAQVALRSQAPSQSKLADTIADNVDALVLIAVPVAT